MSSSFTDQPSPHDPRREEGYTPTPPAPERAREENDVDRGRPRPKLGSLAQKARGSKLKQARGILFFIGGLNLVVHLIFLFLELKQNIDPLLVFVFHGLFMFVGVVFIVLGVLIYRFPLPVTILSLVLYIFVSLIDLGLAAVFEPARMTWGLIWKIIFIIALASSIKSAVAYEKERRAEEDYAYDG